MCKKLICLDTETTGFSREFDKIIEIGCVDITKGISNKKIFQCYINPNRSVSANSTAIHGLKEDFLKQFKSFEYYVKDFLNFIKNATLVIHNAVFDIGFLNAEFKRLELPEINNEIIDTLKIARNLFPGKRATLDALQEYYGIKIQREFHGALLDAEILAHIYIAMQNKQIDLNLNVKIENNNSITPCKKLIKITTEELLIDQQLKNQNV